VRIFKLGAAACIGAIAVVSVLALLPPDTLHESPVRLEAPAGKPLISAERFRTDPLLAPDKAKPWRAARCGMACGLARGDGIRVWYTGQESEEQPYTISRADFDAEWNFIGESNGPVLSGTPGSFDAGGVFMPSVVDCGDHLRMYYACHSDGPFPGPGSSSALAISKDGGDTWEKISQTLTADGADHGGIGTHYGWRDDSEWRMLYTHIEGVRPKMRFFIKFATSADGIHWNRPADNTSLDSGAGTCARPMVVRTGGRYVMLYSSFTSRNPEDRHYRIRWADSDDGLRYVDRGKLLGTERLHPWENELVSYGWAIPDRGLMLYTGDWFGAHGFGVARLTLPETASEK
jgi:predicted GH43/DUF377 family glycosyl hydrolase